LIYTDRGYVPAGREVNNMNTNTSTAEYIIDLFTRLWRTPLWRVVVSLALLVPWLVVRDQSTRGLTTGVLVFIAAYAAGIAVLAILDLRRDRTAGRNGEAATHH
jgi:hypothetical protein